MMLSIVIVPAQAGTQWEFFAIHGTGSFAILGIGSRPKGAVRGQEIRGRHDG
jgi:hypothetical protein